MKTNIIVFLLMTIAALSLVLRGGLDSVTLAVVSFVAGIYFGVLLGGNTAQIASQKKEKEKEE